MKVRELIKLLKEQNQNADVCWQAHDQNEDECDGWVDTVSEGSEGLCLVEGKECIVVLRW